MPQNRPRRFLDEFETALEARSNGHDAHRPVHWHWEPPLGNEDQPPDPPMPHVTTKKLNASKRAQLIALHAKEGERIAGSVISPPP